MAAKQNKTLDEFAEFLTWVEQLKETADGSWLKPIADGKWSLREILAHIMFWDKNSLEMMVPRMEEGARLFFVDIEKHNAEAAVFAQSYTSLDALIEDTVRTRRQLLELLNEKFDSKTKFTIDNSNYTYKKFVHVFIHHDDHHKKQVEAFLEQQQSA